MRRNTRVVLALEDTFRKDFAPLIPYSGKGLEPKDFFSLADELGRLRSQIHNLEHWDQIESQMIAPHINQALQVAARHMNQDKATEWQNWQTRYVSKLLLLLKIIRQEAAMKSEQHLQAVTATLDRFLPEEKHGEPCVTKGAVVFDQYPRRHLRPERHPHHGLRRGFSDDPRLGTPAQAPTRLREHAGSITTIKPLLYVSDPLRISHPDLPKTRQILPFTTK